MAHKLNQQEINKLADSYLRSRIIRQDIRQEDSNKRTQILEVIPNVKYVSIVKVNGDTQLIREAQNILTLLFHTQYNEY